MILLLVLYIHFVATFPDSSLSRNVTTDLRNNACAYRRKMGESVFNMVTPKIPNNPQTPEWLAFDTADLPALKREKRQRSSTLTPEEKWKKDDLKRIDFLKEKALRLMAQAMYATQELIWPMEPIFKKYESEVPYRMAYIFLRMRTIMKEANSIVHVLETRRNISDPNRQWSPTQRIQLYWQLVRKNMDVTYLVDYLIQRVPLGTEAIDTTVPPPTTRGPNTTAKPLSTTTKPLSNTTIHTGKNTRNLPRLRHAYFRRNYKMPPGPGDNKIRIGSGLGKAKFARPDKKKVKRSTP